MRIVGADILIKAARRHPDAAAPLRAWLRIAQEANWSSIADVRRTSPAADGVKAASGATVTVFNIRGNNYRLLAWILYRAQVVSVVDFLTHAEYDKNQWKRRL